MNYGRYFKLNQRTSKVMEGVAVFDYIDLPAFFGPSEEAPITPKHPITLTISADAAIFRLHYSYIKRDDNRLGYNDYLVSLNEISKQEEGQKECLSMVHMEDVILELPYADTQNLSEAVKSVYKTYFPMPSSGGRFLDCLIAIRYSDQSSDTNPTLNELYQAFRATDVPNSSYSLLPEMGILAGQENTNYIDLKENKQITKFLRKLLLDFMFDLHHSDIFQLSPHYQLMHTNLMSDYYFSALLHKCEYYYQLQLGNNAYKQYCCNSREIHKTLRPKRSHNKRNPHCKTYRLRKNRNFSKLCEDCTQLYGHDLFTAEKLWLEDILSPKSEKLFGYEGKKNPWFLSPEEEMRAMWLYKEDRKHESNITNVEHLIRRYKMRKRRLKKSEKTDEGALLTKSLVTEHDHKREEISRWLLRRYDFIDVFGLHLFSKTNKNRILNTGNIITVLAAVLAILFITATTPASFAIPLWGTFCLAACILIIATLRIFGRREQILSHPIACIHLLLPRIVASTAAAWFTFAVGFDIIITFYANTPSWTLIIFVSLVVWFFCIHKIDQVIPGQGAGVKIWRALQLIIFSYLISYAIGTVIIDFLGEAFLDANPELTEGYTSVCIDTLGNHLFVLPSFTAMFSFVAMFIGIFIQLIILGDNKQMTEL